MAAFLVDDVGLAYATSALPPARPGLLWRRAFALVRRQLEADGMPPERAEQAGESALVACALHHDPLDVTEAYQLLLSRVRAPG